MRLRLACGLAVCFACGSSDGASPPVADAGPPGLQRIATIAGKNGESGFADGDASTVARLAYPEGLLLDPAHTHLYIADVNNHAIRRLELATSKLTTVAGVGTFRGSNDTAPGAPARLHTPRNLVFDPSGTGIYFTDTGNYVIRRLDLASGSVTTLFGKPGAPGTTDGIGAAARFGASGTFSPWGGGLAIDTTANRMYVADSANQTIRAIDLATAEVKTIAGQVGVPGSADGIGLAASFNKPSGLALDGRGGLYVTEANNIDIRRIDLATMLVSTVAGKAPANPRHFCENISPVLPPECGANDAPVGRDARFRFPFGVAPDGKGSFYVVDSHNDLVRHFDTASTAVTTVAGVQRETLDDFPRPSEETTASQPGTFSHPSHAAFLPPNVLFVADRSASCIRRVELR